MNDNRLHDITSIFLEDHLQKLINNTDQIGLFDTSKCNYYGLPDDLLSAKIISNNGILYNVYNNENDNDVLYQYKPDCICEDQKNRYIVELKRALKYEPLGIAEVIHHAVCQKRIENINKKIVPVLFSSFNIWNRIVINEINELKSNLSIRFYEVYVLSEKQISSRADKTITTNDIIWFYDPFKDNRNWKNVFDSAEEENGNRTQKICYRYDDSAKEDKYWVEMIK